MNIANVDSKGAWGSLFSFATICPEVVERPFDLLDKLGTGRLMVLPSAMSSLRSELRVEDGPYGVTSKDTIILHIMERPHEQCPHSERRFCACPLNVVHYGGGGNMLWRLLGVKLKRDPHAPTYHRICSEL